MRKLLGLLRDDRPAELGPQPRLADLPDLVETARRAGARVDLTMAAAGPPVPPGIGVCAYRIVQEALSNAGRHSPGAAVSVVVGQDEEVLRLLIVNGPGAADEITLADTPDITGTADAADPADLADLADLAGADRTADTPTDADRASAAGRREPGHGLVGMRERVALLGGSLTSGPADDGGYAVWATLPLSGADQPAVP